VHHPSLLRAWKHLVCVRDVPGLKPRKGQ